jgi:hypothetical protein
MVLSQMSVEKNVRNQVVEILGSEFPLSAKQIFNRVKKRGLSGTYHGVYDCVQEMVRTGVVVKNEKEYQLSGKWVTNTVTQMNKIEINQIQINNVFKSVKGMETARVLKFSSLNDYMKFLSDFKEKFISETNVGEKRTMAWLGKHVVGPALFMNHRSEMINRIKKKGIEYLVAIRGDCIFDKFADKFYKNNCLETARIGVDDKSGDTVAVYDDVVIIAISEDMKIVVNNFCESVSDISDMNIRLLFEDFNKSEKNLYAIMIKNRDLANYYVERIRSLINHS